MSKCPFCKSVETVPNTVRMNHCKECGMHFLHDISDGDNTLFESITRSYDVLAEKLVYKALVVGANRVTYSCWRSTITEESYRTKKEAIATTVAKLKEVEKPK